MMDAPALEARIHELEAECRATRTVERRTGAVGLAVFLASLCALILVIEDHLKIPWWSVPLVAIPLLSILIRYRERHQRQRHLKQDAIRFLQESLARRRDRWDFDQHDGSEYLKSDHLHALDLDLLGNDSIFFRMNGTRTPLGRDRLAQALLEPPLETERDERQEAIQELALKTEFWERFEALLLGWRRTGGQHPVQRAVLEDKTRELLAWSRRPPPAPPPTWHTIRDIGLAVIFLSVIVLIATTDMTASTLLPFYILNLLVLGRQDHIDDNLEHFEEVRHTMGAWKRLAQHVEEHPFESRLLARLRRNLTEPDSATAALTRMGRLVEGLAQHRNEAYQFTVGAALLLPAHRSRALTHWHREYGQALGVWLESLAELEALASMASWCVAQGDATLGVVDPEGPPFSCEDLCHPLLPRQDRIGNSLHMEQPGQTLLVTGSNMSGKSTFLRAMGLAVVLGRMGVHVPAKSLRIRPLDVVTCMRVTDDLKSGASLFLAEVQRLKQCIERARQSSNTMVLLDEILSGTNSKERHIGTRSVLHLLASCGSTNMMATHDLELAEESGSSSNPPRLVHFRDQLNADGTMRFDYQLREGPCPTTNALAILKQAGLHEEEPNA